MDINTFTHRFSYADGDFVIARPGIELVLYSEADLATVMAATAQALLTLFAFIPPASLIRIYQPPPETDDDDEDDSGTAWENFDAARQSRLLAELRAGQPDDPEEGYHFLLSSSPDGLQVEDFGVRFSGASAENLEDDIQSCLRLAFPIELLQRRSIEAWMECLDQIAAAFPLSCGNAGYCFLHSNTFIQEANAWIVPRITRYLGIDSANLDSMRMYMMGKSPCAHWLNFLDADRLARLGGADALRAQLPDCEVKRYPSGAIRIRGARMPPLADVNRGCPDLGRLPDVARALQPIRYDRPLFAGLGEKDAGANWLARFDDLQSKDWNNT